MPHILITWLPQLSPQTILPHLYTYPFLPNSDYFQGNPRYCITSPEQQKVL